MSFELISSKNNSRIKSMRKLRSRQERDRTGTFLVEGIRQVSEAIQSGADLVELVVAPELLRSQFALDLVEQEVGEGTQLLTVSADVFGSFSERDHPHGLAAVVRQRWTNLNDVKVESHALWIALESIADPGNLGTILRTGDAVGASGVILLGQSTDPFDAAVVRASMGAVFTLQIARAAADELVDWARNHRIALAGTSPDATLDYQSVDYPAPLVLLMGSERHGLPENLQRACDPLVRLPMAGRVDSLNLAVATGVVLYEVFNQRRQRAASAQPSRGRGRRAGSGFSRAPAGNRRKSSTRRNRA